MRICITGGSGFIGSYFYDRLAPRGVELVLLDINAPGWDHGDATFVQGDVTKEDDVKRALQGVDAVIHLAAAHRDSGIEVQEYFDVNVGSARVLTGVMADLGIESLCNYSSVAVYGTHPDPPDESTEPRPESPYGKSKLEAEGVFREWVNAESQRRCLNIRPAVVFGPRNTANMYSLIDHLHRRRFWPVGKGDNRKSVAYVENLVDATLSLWSRVDPGVTSVTAAPARPPGGYAPVHWETFNYADKPDLTSREIVRACCLGLDRSVPGPAIPMWLGLMLAAPFDALGAIRGRDFAISRKRVRKLGTSTQFAAGRVGDWGVERAVTVADGLARMSQWYRRAIAGGSA